MSFLRIVAWSLIIVLLGVFSPALLSAESLSEYEVKSALLFNFASFVEWPASEKSAKTDLCIGIMGEPGMIPVLKGIIEGEMIQGKTVHIQEILQSRESLACDVLFISRNVEKNKEVLDVVKAPGVLTIGDSPDFLNLGGIISFFPEKGKMKFSVNLANANKAGIKLSSKLLKLAKKVIE